MHRLFSWLTNRFNSTRNRTASRARQARLEPQLSPPVRKQASVDPVQWSNEPPGAIRDGGPGKNVLVRSKYVREDSGTHETLKIINESWPESDEDPGQDPYNSGRFDRSKSWASYRGRK